MDTLVLDKTGLVTKNRFRVKNIWILEKTFNFNGEAFKPTE